MCQVSQTLQQKQASADENQHVHAPGMEKLGGLGSFTALFSLAELRIILCCKQSTAQRSLEPSVMSVPPSFLRQRPSPALSDALPRCLPRKKNSSSHLLTLSSWLVQPTLRTPLASPPSRLLPFPPRVILAAFRQVSAGFQPAGEGWAEQSQASSQETSLGAQGGGTSLKGW